MLKDVFDFQNFNIFTISKARSTNETKYSPTNVITKRRDVNTFITISDTVKIQTSRHSLGSITKRVYRGIVLIIKH